MKLLLLGSAFLILLDFSFDFPCDLILEILRNSGLKLIQKNREQREEVELAQQKQLLTEEIPNRNHS